MHPDLATRRRLFVQASQSYTHADLAWRQSLARARKLVPSTISRKVAPLGAPGSRMRKLYDDRDKALERLHVARLKLDLARARISSQPHDDTMAPAF
ncbi:MAG: hypothetical protein ACU0A6_10550 [Shimia sp.]|jgi:hypothetical protein|uniref:hypothetical protein n=1 Tax=Shimia sp. TaxID=1954381 RepID=UPI004058FE29